MPDDTQQAAPQSEPVPLDEFCMDASRTSNEVELLAVFRHRELAAGRQHDRPEAYAARFAGTADEPTHGLTRPPSVQG